MESTKQQGELMMEAMQQLYQTQSQTVHKLETQIKRLGEFILSLDCGFPTINDEYPTGMGATEAAAEYIKQLRRLGAAVSASPQPEKLAKLFHETYERLAPQFGYETRKESAKPWSDVPDKNKRLMIAVCAEMSQFFAAAPAQEPDERINIQTLDTGVIDRLDDALKIAKAAQEQPVENSPQKGNP